LKNKTLIILPDLRIGGAEKNSVLIANELYLQGVDVVFVLKNDLNSYSFMLNPKIKIISLNVNRLRNMFIPLIKVLKDEKPELIIASMWPLTTITLISLIISKVRSKIYFIEHVPLFVSRKYETKSSKFIMKLLINLTYGFAQKIICVSSGIKNELLNETFVNKKKFEVIHNPIAPATNNISINESYWKNLNSKKILSVGSLKYAKNHQLLIKSIKFLSEKINCELIIIGEGPLYNDLKYLIATLNLDEKVQILNYRNDISSFYKSADVFALTSRWEGFGNVLIEAMSYGTPVVSTDCPYGPGEIIIDDSLGYLVSGFDPESFSQAILTILGKKNNKEELISYSKKFNVSKQVNKYLKVLNVK